MLFAFWYSSPPRDHWLWLLLLIPLVWVLRWLSYRRLWTRTPLDTLFIIFVLLCIANIYLAPYRRSSDTAYSFFILMARPLMGIALVFYFIEFARLNRNVRGLLSGTLVLGAIVVIFALGASQWSEKSVDLRFIVDTMPNLMNLLKPFDAGGGFNVNEIGGALAWICPFLAGVAVYYFRGGNKLLFILATILFGLLFLAMFLGQSRFALGGVLIALAVLVRLLISNRRWRWLAWGGLAVVTLLEIMIVANVFTGQNTLDERDESSFSTRIEIWGSALHIMRDDPLTGVGLNMFRDGRVRRLYPVPSYTKSVLPHTHQEWLQWGADLGLPGFALYIVLQLVVGWMLLRGYRHGDPQSRAVIIGVAAGLFAHAFFGLGDAITIWDRFAFLIWWLIGLGAAQFYLVTHQA